MLKHCFILFALLGLFTQSVTARTVECRIATSATRTCATFTQKFLTTKTIQYASDKKKLIVDKTLPVPKKEPVKVVSVADMIEKYVKVHDSVRFIGAEELRRERQAFIEKMREEEALKEKERGKRVARKKALEEQKKAKEVKEETAEKEESEHGIYTVMRGDSLGGVAKKFGIKKSLLRKLNHLRRRAFLKIGQKLILPLEQKDIDTIVSGEYIVQKGDTLASIAKNFKLKRIRLSLHNGLKKNAELRPGMKLRLPLLHKLAESKTRKLLKRYGKRKLRVTATAYTSHRRQTDSTPFLAAWNNRLRPGMKIIAVSRDLLKSYGMRNGTKVRIAGLPGVYRVRDKMNKRYRKRIDIYMGLDRNRALRWGRRSVVIYW